MYKKFKIMFYVREHMSKMALSNDKDVIVAILKELRRMRLTREVYCNFILKKVNVFLPVIWL